MTTNVAANVVAPANGSANLWPARIDFTRGGIHHGADRHGNHAVPDAGARAAAQV